jgi:hypothetical protein
MNTRSTLSSGSSGSSANKVDSGNERSTHSKSCCDIDIRIDDARGDVNIYNCSMPIGPGTSPPACPPCFPPQGACLPVVPGAKHKLSREYKLSELAQNARVPSSLGAAVIHVMRRFLLGKPAANPLEVAMFAKFARMSRDILSCTVSAFDAVPPRDRNRLFAQSLVLDSEQPIDEAALGAVFLQEIKQRVGIIVFDDPQGPDVERPGGMRVQEPQGEFTPFQVRICTINDLRTADYIPEISPGDYLPAELQQECQIQIVNGQPSQVCQVQTTNCPGSMKDGVCLRVLDVAQGDGMVFQGVNYFSVDAKVRFTDPQTSNVVRDVDAFVFGDIQTPLTEVISGQTVLINDCRVHDRITFNIPNDLPPAIYQIQVVVPNITPYSAYGAELASNMVYINVIPPSTARFQIVIDTIIARKETDPEWLGSDELGLRTLAAATDSNFAFVELNPLDPDPRKRDVLQARYGDDFDTGTRRDVNTLVFKHDQPIIGIMLLVKGDEIDSQSYYDKELNFETESFWDIVADLWWKEQPYIASLGAAVLGKKGFWWGVIVTAIAEAVAFGIDCLFALWAPADPLIRDPIGLSITDLARLTNANIPPPAPTSFTSEGIVVNVNKTIPPEKLPRQYRETREYVGKDSRYELIYRYNQVA